MFLIYLIVAGLIILCTLYYAGQWEQPEKGFSFFDDQWDIIKFGIVLGVLWPFVICVAPAALSFYLGERRREKINAKKAEKK